MPKFAFYCVVAIILIAGCLCDETETYDVKYDNVDIDEILKSERLLTNYINCLLDEGPCTEDGRELKETLPDAIQTDCSKCSEKQKEGSTKIMHYIIDNRPEDWERLEEIYDESGHYRTEYLESKDAEESEESEE
ncbi:CLUMA_CG016200, isoform A [Clunio marinus]|uniref:CLUMA_CG016200, isoform A n=1 Tax=Clunio marinus TaxID=568069 RepID=A0A1J1IXH0_9DIPT|nr:CLUMA_CG016200, isoform A [Clunio marinus]